MIERFVTPLRALASSAYAGGFGLPLVLLALFGCTVPQAHAAIPAAAMNDALYAKGYLVVTHYPGVFTNETSATTTTAGLNEAIADAYTNNLAVYFPPGTYLVNDTLKAHTAAGLPTNAPGYTSATPRNHIAIVGATTGSRRPVIKLATNATGFGNTGTPKVLLEFKNFDVTNVAVEADGSGYNQMLRGVDLHCGSGNPGTIALYFNQAQDSSIENVGITATGAVSGIRGLPARGSHVVNIEIEGGQYGIDTVGTGSAGTTIVGAVLRNQTVSAVRYDGFVPLVLVGFEIVTPAGSAQAALTIPSSGRAHNSCLNLIDGRITLGAEPSVAAINNSAGMNIYERNVYVTGGNKLLKSGTTATVSGTGTWKRVEEYSYCNQAAVDADGKISWSLIDGIATRTPAPLNNGAVSSITNEATPPPADLLTRHVWTALPSVTDADVADAYALGIQPGNVSSAAFQSVIDSHRKIFLRKGIYFLNGTITLRKDTILFGAGRNLTRIEVQPGWNPTSETAMITTVNDATATTYLGELSIGVDATDLANDWFVALDWQAGRNSMVHMGQVYREPAATTPINRLPTNPHSLIKIRNAGGGRWYSTGSRKNFTSQHPAFRILKVEGTTEPLWFYGLNPEHPAGCDSYVEFTNAKNIRIYGVKSEFPISNTAWEDKSVLLTYHNVQNVAQFGHGAVRNAVIGKGTIEFHNSDRVLATLIAPQIDNGTATGDTLREYVGATNAGIAYPNVVSLYKHGVITSADEAAMTLTTVPSTPGGAESSRLSNLATRGSVNPGDETLIAGFAVSGPGAKTVLLRGIGPGLAAFGVPGSLANPKLTLFDANGATLAENDDWGSASSNATAAAFAEAGAFALNAGSVDAALVTTVNSGAYTVQLSGVGDASGVGLVEVYELDRGSARLVNLSSRLTVGSGASVGIAGFVVSGPVPKKLLIRGIGPTLAQFGVPNPLADPSLSVVGPANTVVAANDNWGTASNAADIVIASASVGAFALPASSSDAAVLVTLPPGAYTASVTGANGTRGVALIEVYEVP